MRILAASEPLPLEKMGFSDRNLREIKTIADKALRHHFVRRSDRFRKNHYAALRAG